MTNTDRIAELRRIRHLRNTEQDGVDSTKRKLAIELLAGPADGQQTDRLVALTLAIYDARGGQ